MTEQEWLNCTDPAPMLEFLRENGGDRKWWLFTVSCFHRVWDETEAEPVREAVQVYERYAEGQASLREIISHTSQTDGYASALSGARYGQRCNPIHEVRERFGQAKLLKDIFGNLFRPVNVDSTWLTPTVTALAEGIYADRAFDRMPILADALQDAGCDNADILSHCRQSGEHVRGCWVIDLILGKT